MVRRRSAPTVANAEPEQSKAREPEQSKAREPEQSKAPEPEPEP